LDRLERQIRLKLLLELVAELYDSNLTDVIAVKEWLEVKADMLRTGRAELPQAPPTSERRLLPG
jgi:hypothetical protein